MPKFFVPTFNDHDAEEWWGGARDKAEEQGAECGARRVFRLRYERDGKELVAEVGEKAEFADGPPRLPVGAIFEALDSYVIWPLVPGPSRTVPQSDAREVVDFDS